MTKAKEFGDLGERTAAEYLRRRGCEILDTQWHCRYGELDLVARDGAYLCFVEVKLRGPRSIALPREFVDARKQEKLRRAALAWMSENHLCDAFARFDVAEVYQERDGSLRLEYLENAFT